MLVEQYRALAGYNRWMNEKVYATAAELPDADRRRDLGAFFRSIHGTLNHLLLADRAWLWRFTRDPNVAESRDRAGTPIAMTGRLDQEIYRDFDELRAERGRTDAHVLDWVETLDDARLAAPLAYRTSAGTACEHPSWWAVGHFFNHQTHHRGQATTLLVQLGRDPGVTDLAAYLRERGAPAAR
jgi:uncharacterized damage-inducible protein DinB